MRGAIVPWAAGAQVAIGMAFGAFVVARAVRMSLTYDEAATYIRYIAPHIFPEFDAGPLAVFNFEVATNHFLSTALTKLTTLAAGSGELALRLPALVAYAMYVWFSARILRRLTSGFVAVAGLLLLNLNPYLLDFFALSRGYGLSIGLMMGALDFWFGGRLRPALLFASAAALANFSMLNVYAALVVIVMKPWRRRTASTTGSVVRAFRPAGSLGLLALVAAVFAALVFSQDPGLSTSLYDPVSTRLAGLTAGDLNAAHVSRVDLRGRETPIRRNAETDAWELPRGAHVRAIRIDLPAAVADRLARIDVVVGNRAFASDPRRPGDWIARERGATRQFESAEPLSNPRSSTREFRSVMNWAGDRQYFTAIARATGLALLVLAVVAILLEAIGRFAAYSGLIPAAVWRIVSPSVLWVGALAGPPLYLLTRDAQLYFGGTQGLVADTCYSLIDSSFYGRVYYSSQTQLIFGVIVATGAVFVAFTVRAFRRNRSNALVAAAQVAALIAIVSVSLIAQRWLFGTVYLVGRTALFFVPLYLLFLILFCQALIEWGRKASVAAGGSILVATVAFSAFHFAQTANLRYTLDWRDDAATKAMMNDLERVVAAEGPSGRKAVLGADWIYAPVAVYYARRHQPVDIDVVVAPNSQPPDFVYVAGRHAGGVARVLNTYPVAGTVLGQPITNH